MNELELTLRDVEEWFVRMHGTTNAVYTLQSGKNVSAKDIVAYVRRLEQRVVLLAFKVADRT